MSRYPGERCCERQCLVPWSRTDHRRSTVYVLFSWYPTYLEEFITSNKEAGWLSGLVMLGGAAAAASAAAGPRIER